MTTKERILNDIKEAMKSGNNARRDTLRMINSAFKQIEVDERVVLDEERIAKILQSEIKRRGDSVAACKRGGRDRHHQRVSPASAHRRGVARGGWGDCRKGR